MRLYYHLFGKHSQLLGPKDAARAKAVNGFGLIVVLTCIVYFVLFAADGDYRPAAAIGVLALICVFPIILNILEAYQFARYWYSFQAPLVIVVYSQLFGKDLGIDIFLLITFAFPFIFLKSSENKAIIVFFFYNSVLVILLEFVDMPIVPELSFNPELKPTLKLAVYLTAILFSGILFFIFFRAIRQNENDLTQAKVEAEKASKARQEFLATMSHEIRTPLNAVITIASMLEDKEEDREALVHSLQLSSKTLLNIINDVLEFSKLEAGKVSLHYLPTDLKRLIENLENTYRVVAFEKGLDFKVDYDGSIHSPLEIDEVRLAQIIGNLLSNAIKFTDKGEVMVKVKKLESDEESEKLHFAVSDTGLGMKEDEVEYIFDSFSQSSTDTARKYGGTGLGLAIVKKLLDKQNSQVKVETQYLKGTEFSFDITFKKAMGLVHTQESINQLDLSGVSILVVEDNHINAVITEKLLSKAGATIDLAENGLKAIEKASKNNYDIILMDIHMPDIDGYEATRRILSLKNHNSSIPIFAFSADVMVNQKEEASKYFTGLLSKPVDRRQLFAALDKAIKSK